MNLYAILPGYAPGREVTLTLARDDDEAMRHGVAIAARDIVDVAYCSPYAEVFCVARDLDKIGDAYAVDAPPEWEWAHPAVEDNQRETSEALARHAAGGGGDAPST